MWIIGHVLSGWDGTNPLEAPTNLCELLSTMALLQPIGRLSNVHHSLPDVSALGNVFFRHDVHLRCQRRPFLTPCNRKCVTLTYTTETHHIDSVSQISSTVIPMKINFRSVTPSSERPCSLIRDAQIFYANNATNISAQTALTTSWIGPSITPLTNLNSGFRVYEVDSAVRAYVYPRLSHSLIYFGQTFDILDAHT